MQRVDVPRSYPTLSAMPHIKASVADARARLAASYPSLRVPVPDREAPRGVLQYSIGPVQRDDGISYGLYFAGQEVPDPRPLLTRYQHVFDDRLSRIAPSVAHRMYRDLSIERDERPIIYARTLPKLDTPLPQHYEPSRSHVTVLHTNDMLRERTTPHVLSPVLSDRMNDAIEQIRMRVASGEIPVMELEDASGYYANIIDTQNGQLHQIGISSRRILPWHEVFQLRNDLDPLGDQYPIPTPRIIGGRVLFDTAHAPYMKHIHTRAYNGDDVVEKQRIKSALGALGHTPGRRVVGSIDRTPPSVPAERYPSNVIPIRSDPEQPDWLRSFLKGTPRDAVSQRQLPPIAPDSYPPSRTRRPEPGEFGWRANDIVDASVLPDWLKEAGGPVQFVQQPIDEGLGLDSHGLPRRIREVHPLHPRADETASRQTGAIDLENTIEPGSLRARDLVNFSSLPASVGGEPAGMFQVAQQPDDNRLVLAQEGFPQESVATVPIVDQTNRTPFELGQVQELPPFPSVASLPLLPPNEPVTVSNTPYNPYELVSFGGFTNIHTTYSFI